MATRYQNQDLRAFAMQKLASRSAQGIPVLDYISWAREFGVAAWETWALEVLAVRIDPVSLEEVQVLGAEAFVVLAARRKPQLVKWLTPASTAIATSNNPPRQFAQQSAQQPVPQAAHQFTRHGIYQVFHPVPSLQGTYNSYNPFSARLSAPSAVNT
jgi:hypothetical protein